jgi:ABC-type bacteriocin/lantibiotic exporter with double-glycine peptidase domain
VILQGVTVSIGGGELAVIVGKTGSGKSSLVNGMLGECRVWGLDAPLVMSARQISYAPQASFIQSGSLRDNILFGSPFDRERYRKVLWCCALDRDIELLPGGDATQLGEKGVNLSVRIRIGRGS